ncbi:MAG: (2Fe-2S)-binding protein [Thermomicrobiales bacterium]|nr:(2Fe-2S)-binding protein [Thermomicrobiales bacterium]
MARRRHTRVADLRIDALAGADGLTGAETLSFTFDGRACSGYAGETLAAALFANGARIFRTMPRTGRPRGGFCFAGRCSDCQVRVDGVPNVMACVTPLRDGMRVETQHGVGVWGEREGGDR